VSVTSAANDMTAAPRRPDPVRVLLVDDSAEMRAGLRALLAARADLARCEVVGEAPTGLAAIRAAGSARPDLVILDGEMPVMGGLAALPHILAAAPRAKVVFHSDYSAEIEALGLGAVAFVRKGDVGRLSEVLQRLAGELTPGA